MCSLSYRQINTFGRGTIRRFGDSVSDMKKMAGFHFENLLLVRTPAPLPVAASILTSHPVRAGYI
jgi:hypothetical protein